MTVQTRTINAILSELRFIPARDHQFDMQRSELNAELSDVYYRYRDTQERSGWRTVPTGRGYSVYNEQGTNVAFHELETVAWGIAQANTP